MPKDLNVFFNPKSIAVIGASRSPEKVGSIVLRNIINSGFKGDIYPINPNAAELNGKKCFPDIFSIPDTCDLVVISLPSEVALEVISQVAKKVGMKVFKTSRAEINLVGIVFSRLEISLKFFLLRSEKSE